ncbi:MAG: hypothetical protein HKN35_13735, partial [Woeseia sp.]|nr:hypothetical protein [Woeseia sp.]
MSLSPIGNSLSIRLPESAPSGTRTTLSEPPAQANNSRVDLLRARDELLQVYDALQRLADLMNIRTNFNVDVPNAESASPLNIDLTTTASTLLSTEAINASPRSFTPFGPDWDNGSTALITVGGEYDGSID